jgi:HAD superfamily hydrolase (TIGR01459 family)
MTAIAFPAGLSALAGRYRVILSDVWGVVHDGLTAHPAAGEALARFRQGGGTVIMVSNAPRPHPSVIRQLDALGVRRDAYDAVITSGDMTAALMRARPGEPCFHIGSPRDEPLFEEVPAERVPLERAAYVVCSGLADDEAETLDDYRDLLARCRRRGLPMICANPDLVVERGDRMIVCAGALADHYASLGGEVTYAGKPHPPIYAAALARAADIAGRTVMRGEVLAIGDAMRTDVAGARGIGVDCLFLAAGIHAAGLFDAEGTLDRAAVDALAERSGETPRFAMARLSWAGPAPAARP